MFCRWTVESGILSKPVDIDVFADTRFSGKPEKGI